MISDMKRKKNGSWQPDVKRTEEVFHSFHRQCAFRSHKADVRLLIYHIAATFICNSYSDQAKTASHQMRDWHYACQIRILNQWIVSRMPTFATGYFLISPILLSMANKNEVVKIRIRSSPLSSSGTKAEITKF